MINFKAIWKKNEEDEVEEVEIEVTPEPFSVRNYRQEVEKQVKGELIDRALLDWVHPELSTYKDRRFDSRDLIPDVMLPYFGYWGNYEYRIKDLASLVGDKIIRELKEQA